MASKRTASGAKCGRVGALLLAPIAAVALFTAIATAAGNAPVAAIAVIALVASGGGGSAGGPY